MIVEYTTEPMPSFIPKQRIEICRSCDSYSLGFCKHCGCLMKLKTHMESAECPENKWGKWNSLKEIIKD